MLEAKPMYEEHTAILALAENKFFWSQDLRTLSKNERILETILKIRWETRDLPKYHPLRGSYVNFS